MNAKGVILIFSIALLASIGGALAYRMVYLQPQPQDLQKVRGAQTDAEQNIVGMRRPDYTLGSSDGRRVSASDFDGNVVLVNFWATWCKPCREEMPMLVELYHAHEHQGFQVVGIALDDVQQARDFALELGVDYPILVGSTDVMVMANVYGNLSGVLPYSVLIDRDGMIDWAHTGVLKEEELSRRLLELLP